MSEHYERLFRKHPAIDDRVKATVGSCFQKIIGGNRAQLLDFFRVVSSAKLACKLNAMVLCRLDLPAGMMHARV